MSIVSIIIWILKIWFSSVLVSDSLNVSTFLLIYLNEFFWSFKKIAIKKFRTFVHYVGHQITSGLRKLGFFQPRKIKKFHWQILFAFEEKRIIILSSCFFLMMMTAALGKKKILQKNSQRIDFWQFVEWCKKSIFPWLKRDTQRLNVMRLDQLFFRHLFFFFVTSSMMMIMIWWCYDDNVLPWLSKLD